MSCRRSLLAVLILVVPLAAAGRDPAAVAEVASAGADDVALVGTWRVESLVVDGKPALAEEAAPITVVNTVGGWAVFVDRKEIARGTNQLFPGGDPKGIDFVVTGSPDPNAARRRHEGIYELTGGTRRICFAPVGAPRPRAFESTKGSGVILVALARIPE